MLVICVGLSVLFGGSALHGPLYRSVSDGVLQVSTMVDRTFVPIYKSSIGQCSSDFSSECMESSFGDKCKTKHLRRLNEQQQQQLCLPPPHLLLIVAVVTARVIKHQLPQSPYSSSSSS